MEKLVQFQVGLERCVAKTEFEALIGKIMYLWCAESGLNVTVWSVPRLQSQLQLPLQVRSGAMPT